MDAIERHKLLTALSSASSEAVEEAFNAASKWPPMNSAHEAFGVLAEEVDELSDACGLAPVVLALHRLWEHVKVNQKRRDLSAMRTEAIQVSAMALRFVVDIVDSGRGRV